MQKMRKIPITKGLAAIVDDDDYEKLRQYNWSYHGRGYAARGFHKDGKLVIVKMHQAVMGKTPEGYVIDHINGNKLDNRKTNLRLVTIQQNTFNSSARQMVAGKPCRSRYKGVHWRDERGKWVSRITKDGKHYYLGLFDTEVQAAAAYNNAAKSLFGDYAKLNDL